MRIDDDFDESISLLAAHARAHNLIGRMRATGARCRLWLTGAMRRLEERVDRIEMLVSGDMAIRPEEVPPGFSIAFAEFGAESLRLVETTGSDSFVSDMVARRMAARLPWPPPRGSVERDLVAGTFGGYIPPWMRSDLVDRSEPLCPTGDVLVVPEALEVPDAKERVTDYLDSIEGDIFVADDGGSVASLLALLNKRTESPRIRLASVCSGPPQHGWNPRGSIVVLDASGMAGSPDCVCSALGAIRRATDRPLLLLNPTGRLPANDMFGDNRGAAEIAQCCASAECAILVCGHAARLSPGDGELAEFLRAGCGIALGSGAARPRRCAFGLECAAAMAARAGVRPRDLWRSPEAAERSTADGEVEIGQ